MNFNVNNVNKKIVLIFSLIGFVLSFFTGIFSGNNFVNLFFHSILSGVVMGGIVFGANLVVMVYLPELLANDSDYDDGGDDSPGQVNIVMPEEGYTVQSESGDDSTDGADFSVSTNSSSGVNEDVREVGLDNLQSMSNTGILEEAYADDSTSDGGDFTSSSVSNKNVPMEEHSVDDMAKAVKTVLKRD